MFNKLMSRMGPKIQNAIQQAQANKGSGLRGAIQNVVSQIKANKPTKPMKKGGSVGSASKRADGCCIKGKTRGKML